MTRPFEPPTPEQVAKIRALAEQPLPAEEFDRQLRVPLSDAERNEGQSLIRWFTRRYPTVEQRLAYARRAYARWAAAMPKPK